MLLLRWIINLLLLKNTAAFWDMGTTTIQEPSKDDRPRQSQFRWMWTTTHLVKIFFSYWDWNDIYYRRRLGCICGYSIYFTNLGTGVILNRRTTISAANLFENWKLSERDVRIWALGREGNFRSPFRYRVWKIRRVIPKSKNPEHCHGVRCRHVPRHDVAIIHSMDQIYHNTLGIRFLYAIRCRLTSKHYHLGWWLWMGGCGFGDVDEIRENYKILYHRIKPTDVVDCSKYLPKWWGKFICFKSNAQRSKIGGLVACIPNGMGLLDYDLYLYALGCFEIRYNEDRIFVFTDLRYYIDWIYVFANITVGDYYEYAYQMWGATVGLISDSNTKAFIPNLYLMYDHYPLGK